MTGVGKSYISGILKCKKGMTEKVIWNMANHFKIRWVAFLIMGLMICNEYEFK